MKIAIVGLGLIGGSFAKAIKKNTDHYVIGLDINPEILKLAKKQGAIDDIGTDKSLITADLIILCIYPHTAVEFVCHNGANIKKDAVVIDTSGIKSEICRQMEKLSKKFDFTFIGTHPMAGKEKNGFLHSDSDLFHNASFIICPCDAPENKVDALSELAISLGFGQIKITTPEEHDRMIAFTSQLPHVLACSYVLSPNCKNHKGFSAGSYKDVSRVANINAKLWSELFLENKRPLLKELDMLISNINKVAESIRKGDSTELENLLEKAAAVKRELNE